MQNDLNYQAWRPEDEQDCFEMVHCSRAWGDAELLYMATGMLLLLSLPPLIVPLCS